MVRYIFHIILGVKDNASVVTKHLSGHRSPHGSLAVSGATHGAGCLAIHHNPAANVTKSTFGCFLCLRQAHGSVRGISYYVLRSDVC